MACSSTKHSSRRQEHQQQRTVIEGGEGRRDRRGRGREEGGEYNVLRATVVHTAPQRYLVGEESIARSHTSLPVSPLA